MKTDKAKSILRVYRAGGGDEEDPVFREALEQVKGDSGLADWFEDQRRFDLMVGSGLRSAPVPDGLKAALLAESGRIGRQWWRRPVRLALAASLIGFLGLAAWVVRTQPLSTAEVSREVVDGFWSVGPHLELKSSELPRIRAWLRSEGVYGDFEFPSTLESHRIVGGRILSFDGHKGAAICLQDGSEHAHFMVVPVAGGVGLSAATAPVFERVHGWETVSWRQGDRLYVVSGMTIWKFVQLFRKDGQWVWVGRREAEPGRGACVQGGALIRIELANDLAKLRSMRLCFGRALFSLDPRIDRFGFGFCRSASRNSGLESAHIPLAVAGEVGA